MAPELELESVIDTTMSVPSGIDIGIDNPNPNRDVDEHSSAGYHMRWSRLSKSVTVQAAETGLMGRASISTTFQTSTETNKKTILDQVSGSAAPGQVLCVMGPSGSGKTSLMNALSGRAKFQSGVVSLNGVVVSDAAMKRLQSKIAYVKQSDVFFDHLSVRDQLTYTALLRMKSSLTTQAKHTAVTAVLEQLRLVSVAESPIRLLSGGEKKRVNIGTELLTNPAVLLLDEPTSGLDSTSAVSLLTMLRHLAIDQKKTVMTSIHQPSSGVFFAFDKLLLLSKGSVVYFGTPLESLNYLKLKQLECPAGYNAADHWMDLLVTDPAVEPERLEKKHDSQSPRLLLQQAWDKEAVAEQMDACLIDNSNNGQGTDTTSTTMDLETSKYNTSWATQYRILTHRALKNSRSAIFTTLNLTKSLVTGAIAGMLWFQLEYTEKNVNDIRSYYFFTMTFWVFDSMFGALTAFPTERAVITRERSSGSYHLSAYFMAKTTSDAPVRLLLPFLYMTVSFWMAGIDNRFSVFIGTVGCTLLSVLSGEALGLFIGAAVYDLEKALTIMTVAALALMLLGGFFVENVPDWLVWGKYLSPFKYAFDSSLQLIFDRNVPCDGSGALEELCGGADTGVAQAADVRDFIGIQGTMAFNVGVLLIICFLPRYWAYVALKWKQEGERS